MKTNLVILTLIFYFFTFFVFFLCKAVEKKTEARFADREKISPDALRGIVRAGNVPCSVEYGKIWSCDVPQKTIRIPQKDSYTAFDVFCLLHETGHYRDAAAGCPRVCRADRILRIADLLLYLPVLVLAFILTARGGTTDAWGAALPVILSVFLGLLLTEICLTVVLELRASRWAISRLRPSPDEKSLRCAAVCSMLDQITVKWMFAYPIFEFLLTTLG